MEDLRRNAIPCVNKKEDVSKPTDADESKQNTDIFPSNDDTSHSSDVTSRSNTDTVDQIAGGSLDDPIQNPPDKIIDNLVKNMSANLEQKLATMAKDENTTVSTAKTVSDFLKVEPSQLDDQASRKTVLLKPIPNKEAIKAKVRNISSSEQTKNATEGLLKPTRNMSSNTDKNTTHNTTAQSHSPKQLNVTEPALKPKPSQVDQASRKTILSRPEPVKNKAMQTRPKAIQTNPSLKSAIGPLKNSINVKNLAATKNSINPKNAAILKKPQVAKGDRKSTKPATGKPGSAKPNPLVAKNFGKNMKNDRLNFSKRLRPQYRTPASARDMLSAYVNKYFTNQSPPQARSYMQPMNYQPYPQYPPYWAYGR